MVSEIFVIFLTNFIKNAFTIITKLNKNNKKKKDANHNKNNVDDSNGSRRSLGTAFKRPRYLVDGSSRERKREDRERRREKFNVDDEATLRVLLLE